MNLRECIPFHYIGCNASFKYERVIEKKVNRFQTIYGNWKNFRKKNYKRNINEIS